jgi:hypothetical protein
LSSWVIIASRHRSRIRSSRGSRITAISFSIGQLEELCQVPDAPGYKENPVEYLRLNPYIGRALRCSALLVILAGGMEVNADNLGSGAYRGSV